jgi:hypothetical protein
MMEQANSKLPPLKPFTEEVIEGFKKLGQAQRNKPESAMTKVQFTMGGGVLNPLVEHVGDISHRMVMHVQYVKPGSLPKADDLGYSYVIDKVSKTLRWLQSSYGFEREFKNNIVNNAAYNKVDVDDLRKRIDVALSVYAREHAQLVVYNKAQWTARDAAIALGHKEWSRAEDRLTSLKYIYCKDEKSYLHYAADYTLKTNGQLQEYD